jgi:uncharacterized protein involved in exopolysaccharide biosynthesis
MNEATAKEAGDNDPSYVPTIDLIDLLVPLLLHWRSLSAVAVTAGLIAAGIAFSMPKYYLSRTVFLPPQQQQSAASSALAQLGALSGLAGATAGIRTPGDQYVALLESQLVADRIIDAMGLMKVYEAEFRFEARDQLRSNSRISLGRKDGLITIDVEDRDPQRAADIANRYVDELRRLGNELALTEAQQRRAFMEQQLKLTRMKLAAAQSDLAASGFDQGALKADARAASESYARLRAEVAAAEIRLKSLQLRLSDNTPEVRASASTLEALRNQLARAEVGNGDPKQGHNYISKFREYKYQETLFELFARQYEAAKVDESREGALIQVVDVAKPAEWKSRPRRAVIVIGGVLGATLAVALFIVMRHLTVRRSGNSIRERVRAARAA